MPSEKSLANIKPWKKGESGNPSGRPKRRPITEAYMLLSKRKLPKKIREALGLSSAATWADGVAYGQMLNAAKGKHGNAQEIREAIEGKATQRIELSGAADAAPIRIESVDIRRLSKEDLLAYRAILQKASARRDP